jgi:arylsulfatase A-like enzyme
MLLAPGCADRVPRNPDANNVVFVSIDCMNQRQLETGIREGYAPVLAAIAADGVEFARAYTHAPWTTPSHASMMTGLYPHQHGHTLPYRLMLAEPGASPVRSDQPNLPETLAAAGYETVGFVGHGPISARYGLGRGFQRYVETAKNHDESDLPETLGVFQEWLDEGGEAPFFAFVHTFDLHDPYPPTRPDDRSAVSYIDRRLGELVEMLKERGLYQNTLIVVTGDHGSRMIRTEGKCCIHGAGHYEENLNVPLLIKWPGAVHRGRTQSIARHVDLFATVVEAVGVAIQEYHGPGVSLAGVFSGSATTPFSYSEADARCSMRYALVSNDYKYIFTPRDALQRRMLAAEGFRDKYCMGLCADLPKREEFYDLRADPFEQRDLLGAELGSKDAEALALHRRAFADQRALPVFFERADPAPVVPDPDLEDSLRKLGYLE